MLCSRIVGEEGVERGKRTRLDLNMKAIQRQRQLVALNVPKYLSKSGIDKNATMKATTKCEK